MTKAIIIKKPGGPEVLEITDIKLEAPGSDQIKVKNIAIGLKLYRHLSSFRFVSCSASKWHRS